MRVSDGRMIRRATLNGLPSRPSEMGKTPNNGNLQSTITTELLPTAKVSRSEDTLRILLPLCGVDVRDVFVLAGPRSLAIEIRKNNTVDHSEIGITEVQAQRFVRELRLCLQIREGSTTVKTVGDDLEITCLRTDAPDDRVWSELLSFNTRSSLGCV